MVSIMVQWTDANDGGKIASYPCKEADVTGIVADFEAEYGAVKQINLDDGVVYGRKGNKKYGFRLFADKHELLVRTTEAQMERLMDTIVTDEFEKHFVSEDYGYIETLFDRKTEGSETMTEKTERMNFDELKAQAENVAENVADWKQTNVNIRNELKRKGVKCRTAFYNPQDHKAYIKQTFRKMRIEGVEQIANTWEDVLFFVCDGDERQIQGYWDDEYIAIDVHLLLEDFETETEADDGMVGLSEVCTKIRSLGATETTIAFNPIHNEDGSSDAKIYYYDGIHNEFENECFDVNVKTIGELEYLKENLPNVVSDSATTFWDNPSLLFCNGFVIQDKEFQMVKGLLLYCKISDKKLYYRTYESGEWNEIKEESLEELKFEASKHPLGKWRYTGLGGTLGKMLYALTYHSTDIKMAVMSGYDSIYCEGTSLTGDTFQLRY